MSEIEDLYQEVVLDHHRSPRNFRTLAEATRSAEGFNPLCGDRCTVYLRLEGEVIRDISFQGAGCAISQASASMMTEFLKGKSREEAEASFRAFHHLVTGEGEAAVPPMALGKLEAFSNLSSFPTRVKCASLAWHTMRAALRGEGPSVTLD